MACSCCSTGCKCIVPGGSDSFDTTPNPNKVYDFSFMSFNTAGPWINRKYPIPMYQATYDKYSGQRYAPNAVFKDGLLYYPGDIQYEIGFSRSGIPAGNLNNALSSWQVPDWDGDGSASFKPDFVESDRTYMSYTNFDLKEIQDTDKRECQLWITYTKQIPRFYDEINNRNIYYEFIGPSEPELLYSIKWNEPMPQQITITLPGSKFSNIDNVEIRYYCRDVCTLFNSYDIPYTDDGKVLGWTWTMTGQPSYISKSTIEFDQFSMLLESNSCTSYGSYNGTHVFNAIGCEDYPWVRSITTNTKSEAVVLLTAGCFAGQTFYVQFSAFGNCCEIASGTSSWPCSYSWYYPVNRECCNNIYGTYQTLEDGTENCSCGGWNAWADFGGDRYAIEIINAKKFVVKGGWRYNVENYTNTYSCREAVANPRYRPEGAETFIYTAGTLTINGV